MYTYMKIFVYQIRCKVNSGAPYRPQTRTRSSVVPRDQPPVKTVTRLNLSSGGAQLQFLGSEQINRRQVEGGEPVFSHGSYSLMNSY